MYSNEMGVNNTYYRSPEYTNLNPYLIENLNSQEYPQTSNAYNVPFT